MLRPLPVLLHGLLWRWRCRYLLLLLDILWLAHLLELLQIPKRSPVARHDCGLRARPGGCTGARYGAESCGGWAKSNYRLGLSEAVSI